MADDSSEVKEQLYKVQVSYSGNLPIGVLGQIFGNKKKTVLIDRLVKTHANIKEAKAWILLTRQDAEILKQFIVNHVKDYYDLNLLTVEIVEDKLENNPY